MPKKTRREKLLAVKHREKKLTDLSLTSETAHSYPLTNPNTIVMNKPASHDFLPNYSYIRSDLIKILSISLAAFVLEGILYLFLSNRIFIR